MLNHSSSTWKRLSKPHQKPRRVVTVLSKTWWITINSHQSSSWFIILPQRYQHTSVAFKMKPQVTNAIWTFFITIWLCLIAVGHLSLILKIISFNANVVGIYYLNLSLRGTRIWRTLKMAAMIVTILLGLYLFQTLEETLRVTFFDRNIAVAREEFGKLLLVSPNTNACWWLTCPMKL